MEDRQLIHIDQMLSVEELIEEIEFSKSVVIGTNIGRCELFVEIISTDTIYGLLKKYFPQIQTYIDGRLQQ